MGPGEAALRAELDALRARVIRLERRFDAAGIDTLPGPPTADTGCEQSSGSLLDAIGEGLEALGALKP